MQQIVKDIARKYLEEINKDFEYSKIIIQSVGKEDEELVEFVNDSAIISMCIKYESFTSEVMYALKEKDIAYNKPWQYTRYFMRIFKMDIDQEYDLAHDAWEYYNSIKHENHKSRVESTKFIKKHNIKNSWDALRFSHNAIILLLSKFAGENSINRHKK